MRCRFRVAACLSLAVLAVPLRLVIAETTPPPATTAPVTAVKNIEFIEETFPNGLRVIYAPLHQAPVVHVRVLYHVGSRDERPDRQGFAHMFEHMMFRGSRHVPPQEHMKLIDQVGGNCNAFTSFDQTVYYDTVPAEDLDMALYLEADRMSSFKVTDQIYQIERKVVAQEWMLKQNKPMGNLFDDLLKCAYTTSSYQWTPIGNMQQLLAAPAAELQDFYNTYYVPNNAVLVISGDIDVPSAKAIARKYFAWIPKGGEVPHRSPAEPPQQQPRAVKSPDRLARQVAIVMGYHIPPYKSDDHYALTVLSTALGGGSSSRLEKLLVNNDKPLCGSASTLYEPLEYGGMFGVVGEVLQGKNAEEVKAILANAVADIVEHGISSDELSRVKTLARIGMIHGRETAEQIAGDLGNEELWANDPNRVNNDLAKLDAVTGDDVQAVARKYLQPNQVTVLTVQPDPLGTLSRKSASAARALFSGAPVAPSTQPILAREVAFPAGYPEHPPLAAAHTSASFAKGQEATINGVHLVVLTYARLPLVNWTLAMRRGSHGEPADKAGLAGLTADMLRRGAADVTFQQLSDELENHAISIGVGDGGDTTRLSGSCPTVEIDHGFARSRDILLKPTFPAEEFAKLKEQASAGLAQSLATPSVAAERQLVSMLNAGSPLGHLTTPETLANITLEDVKKFYAEFYHPNDAILVISGDVSFERGQQLVRQLTDGWKPSEMPKPDYNVPPVATSRKIVLIDTGDANPGAGAVVRMGIKTYTIHDDEKFAGSLAGTLLSAGIESRLMEYVRAQKGYVYGVGGSFQPTRYTGVFSVNAPTRPPVTGDCITAVFKVLDDLKNPAGDNPLTNVELDAAKRRVGGSMVMNMQTINEQAGMRLDGLLNGYPVDYYDVYPQHINAVTVDQVRDVMSKYVKPDAMTIVVAAPASVVKEQLEKLGEVTVMPMPASKTPDLLK